MLHGLEQICTKTGAAKPPPRVILSKQTPLCGCLRVELSKICNKLLIFESQNAVRVLRIYEGDVVLVRSERLCRSPGTSPGVRQAQDDTSTV